MTSVSAARRVAAIMALVATLAVTARLSWTPSGAASSGTLGWSASGCWSTDPNVGNGA
jgi:hypothetical protein